MPRKTKEKAPEGGPKKAAEAVKHVVIVTGISGSGKTTALRAFEDRGFFCIDNMPLPLIPDVVNEINSITPQTVNVALGIDIREKQFLSSFKDTARKIADMNVNVDLLYLESSEEVLLRRFSETRRPHPLVEKSSDLKAALEEEKKLLADMRNRATFIIDSSALNVHQLKERVFHFIDTITDEKSLAVIVMSFGFKNGIPLEADLVFDLRFLPNPYFDPELKNKTGLDQAVYDFVFSNRIAENYYKKVRELVLFTMPHFYDEGKAYLTVAFGCTGGKHRSISFARRLYEDLQQVKEPKIKTIIRHRDLGKE